MLLAPKQGGEADELVDRLVRKLARIDRVLALRAAARQPLFHHLPFLQSEKGEVGDPLASLGVGETATPRDAAFEGELGGEQDARLPDRGCRAGLEVHDMQRSVRQPVDPVGAGRQPRLDLGKVETPGDFGGTRGDIAVALALPSEIAGDHGLKAWPPKRFDLGRQIGLGEEIAGDLDQGILGARPGRIMTARDEVR